MATIETTRGLVVVPPCPAWCVLPADHDLDVPTARDWDGSVLRMHIGGRWTVRSSNAVHFAPRGGDSDQGNGPHHPRKTAPDRGTSTHPDYAVRAVSVEIEVVQTIQVGAPLGAPEDDEEAPSVMLSASSVPLTAADARAAARALLAAADVLDGIEVPR